jgi:hypothetical protein
VLRRSPGYAPVVIITNNYVNPSDDPKNAGKK